MSPVVREGDGSALRHLGVELSKAVADLCTTLLAPFAKPARPSAPNTRPRFIEHRFARDVFVLHDRKTDRTILLTNGETEDVARVLTKHDSAYLSSRTVLTEVHLRELRGEGRVVLPGETV